MERWKNIKGYEGLYQVSNNGNVKSLVSNKLLKQCINQDGYHQVCLYKNGHKKNMLVHRLIAEAFIPNPDNKPTINHIDGNRANNDLNNLEYATMQEQLVHSVNILGHKRIINDYCRQRQKELHEKKVKRSDGIIFNSIKEASGGNETLRKCINKCVKGYCKTASGYSWQYL